MLATIQSRTMAAQMVEDADARLIEAIVSPVRQRILRLLMAHPDTMTVERLVECFEQTQPTISHHLRILRSAGLLYRRKQGNCTYYCVDLKRIAYARDLVIDLVTF